VSPIILGLAILAAFWHWPLRRLGNPKVGFPRSFESLTVRRWQWASTEWDDGHQDAVLIPGQQLGPALEHGTNTFQLTTEEALCFADPIAPTDQPCIDM
jgi:hypothetical protein